MVDLIKELIENLTSENLISKDKADELKSDEKLNNLSSELIKLKLAFDERIEFLETLKLIESNTFKHLNGNKEIESPFTKQYNNEINQLNKLELLLQEIELEKGTKNKLDLYSSNLRKDV